MMKNRVISGLTRAPCRPSPYLFLPNKRHLITENNTRYDYTAHLTLELFDSAFRR